MIFTRDDSDNLDNQFSRNDPEAIIIRESLDKACKIHDKYKDDKQYPALMQDIWDETKSKLNISSAETWS